MNSLKRTLKYKFKNTGKSVITFWIIVLMVDLASIFLNIQYGKKNIFYLGFTNVIDDQLFYSLMGVNMLPILIYFIVFSYTNFYEDFSRMINFSITRETIIKANIFSNIILVFIFALIQSILMKLDPFILGFIDRKPLYEFFLFNTRTDGVVFITGVLFISLLVFSSLWTLIASLNYKYGAKIWILFLAIFFMGNNIIINSYSFFDLILPGNWLNRGIDMNRFIIYVGFIIFAQGSSYLVARKTNQ